MPAPPIEAAPIFQEKKDRTSIACLATREERLFIAGSRFGIHAPRIGHRCEVYQHHPDTSRVLKHTAQLQALLPIPLRRLILPVGTSDEGKIVERANSSGDVIQPSPLDR